MNNNEKVDFLHEDPEIPSQRFCCLSFIEPRDRNLVKEKEVFMASRFIKAFIEEYETAKEFASNPNNTITEEIKNKLDLSFENISKTYKGYRKTHFTNMTQDFDKNHNPKDALTVSGVKVRGSYRTLQEAEDRAQRMREFEPASDCFVAQVGYWLPYDPENMEDIKAQFREEQLNTIYGEKQEALEKAKVEFDNRKYKMIEKNKQEQELKKQLFNSSTTHEERKEDVVLRDEPEKQEKPKEKPKKKRVSKAANKRKINRKN